MPRVIFVCAGNICRSALAAALFRKALERRGIGGVEVESAGLIASEGEAPVAQTLAAAREAGVDLSEHRARRVARLSFGPQDQVLVMERGQRDRLIASRRLEPERVRLLGALAPGAEEIADPGGKDDAAFTACAERIAGCVEALAGEFEGRAGGAAASAG